MKVPQIQFIVPSEDIQVQLRGRREIQQKTMEILLLQYNDKVIDVVVQVQQIRLQL